MQNSESFIDDMSSLGQDLLSTMVAERYDSVRECLESEQIEKPQKLCSLAMFGEGNDIARRSFKRPRGGKVGREVNVVYYSNTLFFIVDFSFLTYNLCYLT